MIGGACAVFGAAMTYLGLRSQILENRRNSKLQSSRELGAAELSYMERLQEMLVQAGQTLLNAEEEHHATAIVLERAKYVAEEAFKHQEKEYAEAVKHREREHAQVIRDERRFAEEQHEEILRLQAEIKRLELVNADLKRTMGFIQPD